MKIRVLKTTKGATCAKGIECRTYEAGQTYEIFDELAQLFIREGWGVSVEGSIVKSASEDENKAEESKENSESNSEEKSEEKAIEGGENKAVEKAPENKSIFDKFKQKK